MINFNLYPNLLYDRLNPLVYDAFNIFYTIEISQTFSKFCFQDGNLKI